mgnify:CR=1 FL=1
MLVNKEKHQEKEPLFSEEYLKKHIPVMALQKNSKKSNKTLFLVFLFIAGLSGYLTFKPDLNNTYFSIIVVT